MGLKDEFSKWSKKIFDRNPYCRTWERSVKACYLYFFEQFLDFVEEMSQNVNKKERRKNGEKSEDGEGEMNG